MLEAGRAGQHLRQPPLRRATSGAGELKRVRALILLDMVGYKSLELGARHDEHAHGSST